LCCAIKSHRSNHFPAPASVRSPRVSRRRAGWVSSLERRILMGVSNGHWVAAPPDMTVFSVKSAHLQKAYAGSIKRDLARIRIFVVADRESKACMSVVWPELRVPQDPTCAALDGLLTASSPALLSFPLLLSTQLSSSGWPGWLAAPVTLLLYTSTPDSC
jgi:hypothetical protein